MYRSGGTPSWPVATVAGTSFHGIHQFAELLTKGDRITLALTKGQQAVYCCVPVGAACAAGVLACFVVR